MGNICQTRTEKKIWILVLMGLGIAFAGCKSPTGESITAPSKSSETVSPEDKKLADSLLSESVQTEAPETKPVSQNENLPVEKGNQEGAAARVWVFKEDGSKSCEGMGEPMAAMQAQLKKAGVEVFSSKKANDQKMHIQMCGASTGKGYLFEIATKDLPKAIENGFERR